MRWRFGSAAGRSAVGDELGEDAVHAAGVEEAGTELLRVGAEVNHLEAFVAKAGGVCGDVVAGVAEVVHAGPALLEPAADAALGVLGQEDLDAGFAETDLDEEDLGALGGEVATVGQGRADEVEFEPEAGDEDLTGWAATCTSSPSV